MTTPGRIALRVAPLLLVALAATGAVQARPPAAPAGTLVFTSNRTGDYEIYSIRADGTHPGRLTHSPTREEEQPRFSPDGRRILFVRGSSLWVMNADGSHERQIDADASEPVWAPDSRRIAYGTFDGAIVVANVDRSTRRRIAAGQEPSWSPRGTRLAFMQDVGVNHRLDIGIADADGRNLRTVVRDMSGLGPQWSPGSSLIAFRSRRGELFVVNADTSLRRKLADEVRSAAWSPDGRRLAFIGPDTRVKVVRPSDRRTWDVTPKHFVGFSGPLTWSPDARWIGLLSGFESHPVMGGHPRHDVILVRADGSRRRMLVRAVSAPFARDNAEPNWRPALAGTARLGGPIGDPPRSETASPVLLRATARVLGLAADGGRVAVAFDRSPDDCSHVAVWKPGSRPLHVRLQEACGHPYGDGGVAGAIALAGKRVAWTERDGFTGTYLSVADTSRPRGVRAVDSRSRPSRESEEGNHLTGLHAAGALIAYSTMAVCSTACGSGSEPWRDLRVERERLWRLDGARPAALRSGAGSFEPQDVEAGRVAVLEPGGAVDVLRADGSLVTRIALSAGTALSAQVAGTRLVVLTATALSTYDATTGAAVGTVPLAPSVDRALADLDQGIAVLVEGRTVHAIRLADGHRTMLAPPGAGPVFAQIDPAGLFTGYTLRTGTRPGRVSFLARDRLLARFPQR